MTGPPRRERNVIDDATKKRVRDLHALLTREGHGRRTMIVIRERTGISFAVIKRIVLEGRPSCVEP